jgi:dipeptidase E
MELFVSGGGDAQQSRLLDALFAKRIGKNGRVLYIPIAMPVKEHSYGACYDWMTITLSRHGLLRADMWTDVNYRRLEDLHGYDAIYIGGGNAFSLLDVFRRTGFAPMLQKYIARGGIVYGGSAGAIILGKNIATARFGNKSDSNLVKLRNLRGLNLFGGFSLKCHYTEDIDNEIFRYVAQTGIPTIALPEETGLHLQDGEAVVVGYCDAYLFARDNKLTLKIGKALRISKNS